MNAFQQIATQKTSGIGAVAGGISEALVTTAFGLLVAIPAVMTFNYFTGKVEAFDVEMDNSSSELVDYFIKQSHRRKRRLCKHSTAGILHRLERTCKIRSNLVVFTGLTESHLEDGQAWSAFHSWCSSDKRHSL